MAYTERSFLREQSEIIRRIENASDKLADRAEAIEHLLTEANAQEYRKKISIALALDEIAREIPEIVQLGFIDACMQTEEYNFAPYLNHLKNAIDYQIDNMVGIAIQKEGKPTLFLKADVLGTGDEWIDIVNATREEMGLGSSRGHEVKELAQERYPDEADYGDLASRIFAEKFYKVDREGKRVKKVVKVNKGEDNETTKTIDTTRKYKGRYTKTIEERLSRTPEDKAPFWYFVENGNAVAAPAGGGAYGDPYPKIEPTRAEDSINEVLNYIFDEAYQYYFENAEEYFLEEVYRKAGIKGKASSFEHVPEDVEEYIKEQLTRAERGEELENTLFRIDEAVREGAQTVISTSTLFVRISSRGKISAQPILAGHRFGTFRRF